MKAAITPLALVGFLGTASLLPAQQPYRDEAVKQGVMRQEKLIQLRTKLEAARVAEQQHDLPKAAKLYDDSWSLVEQIGPIADKEAQQTVAGLTETRMQLARDAKSRGDLLEADNQVKDVLHVNPHDPEAVAFQKEVKQAIDD